jgi:hypothetical protein
MREPSRALGRAFGDDLKEIGVTLGHRRILLEAIAGLSNEKTAGIPAVSPAPAGRSVLAVQCLREIPFQPASPFHGGNTGSNPVEIPIKSKPY